MVYCTCSFAPEENEMVIDELLKSNQRIQIVKIEPIRYGIDGLPRSFNNNKFNTDIKNTKRLYPHLHNTNGFFIAKLKKYK